MGVKYTQEQVEAWRDRVHRRSPGRAVGTKRQALAFIDSVGFCFAFKAENSELPCLWHAAMGMRNPILPLHTHHDPGIGFVWEMKDVLPAEGKIYYGKLLKSRPTMVSLAMLPYFYVLAGRSASKGEAARELRAGRMSGTAYAILEALSDSSPQNTKGLKLATGLHTPGDRIAFDRAMAELQGGMFIVKVAEEVEQFSFVWAPFDRTFPAVVRKARRITEDEARIQILERYFANQLVGTVPAIQRLFRWSRQSIFQTLGVLVARGVLRTDVTVDGNNHRYYSYIEQR